MINENTLQTALQQQQQQYLYRQRHCFMSPQGVDVIIDGQRTINFSNSDYLGLANHPHVVQAFCQAANDYGIGSTASPLVCGHTALHHQLEEELAVFVGRDSALLYNSGYMANLAIISTLCQRGDIVFADKLNHASLLDAVLLSRARLQRFAHGNIAQLEQQLAKPRQGNGLLAVESVFSMEGDLAPLAELAALAQRYHVNLVVDDAHGFGVLGEKGAGGAEHFQLDQQQLPILMGTLSKAIGCHGAFVAGSHTLIDTLIQFSRPYRYSSSLPPALAAAALASLQVLRNEPDRRAQLQQRIAYFKKGAAQRPLALLPAPSAIQSLVVGDSQAALSLAAALQQRGFWVVAIRPPSVPVGSARLRITLSVAHHEDHIDRLLDTLLAIMPP